jgi:hypothetical protein
MFQVVLPVNPIPFMTLPFETGVKVLVQFYTNDTIERWTNMAFSHLIMLMSWELVEFHLMRTSRSIV